MNVPRIARLIQMCITEQINKYLVMSGATQICSSNVSSISAVSLFPVSLALPGHFPSLARFLFPSFLHFLPPVRPLFTGYFPSFSFQALPPSSHSYICLSPIKSLPLSLILSLSFSASLLGGCICVTTIMSSSYTRRCATYKLAWFVLGKMVVFEYNMYLVYPTG